MPRHTLYTYVDGFDLEAIAAALEARLDAFVSGRRWVAGKAWVVNQRYGWETCTQPGDLVPWDLGLNLQLPDPGAEPPGWFADVEMVAQFLGRLHGEFGRDFVMGISDAETGITEDLFHVETASPDLQELRLIVGVGSVRYH
jgi:hypothetical protein